mgnify:CR=1 FL=1
MQTSLGASPLVSSKGFLKEEIPRLVGNAPLLVLFCLVLGLLLSLLA